MIKTNPDGSVEADRIQVPGIIKDAYGEEWAVPADELAYDELLTDPLKLPKKDPNFHYQFVREDQVTAKATEGFKPVRREEVGVQNIITRDVGSPLADYHQVHDLLLMKIPKVLADRRYRALKRMADEAVEQITDPQKLAKAGGQDRQLTRSSEPFEVEGSDPGLDHFKEPEI